MSHINHSRRHSHFYSTRRRCILQDGECLEAWGSSIELSFYSYFCVYIAGCFPSLLESFGQFIGLKQAVTLLQRVIGDDCTGTFPMAHELANPKKSGQETVSLPFTSSIHPLLSQSPHNSRPSLRQIHSFNPVVELLQQKRKNPHIDSFFLRGCVFWHVFLLQLLQHPPNAPSIVQS